MLVAKFAVDPADASALYDIVLVELAALHEGNSMTYQLHPAEVVAWRANGSPR